MPEEAPLICCFLLCWSLSFVHNVRTANWNSGNFDYLHYKSENQSTSHFIFCRLLMATIILSYRKGVFFHFLIKYEVAWRAKTWTYLNHVWWDKWFCFVTGNTISQACGLTETLLQVSGKGSPEIFRFSVGVDFYPYSGGKQSSRHT